VAAALAQRGKYALRAIRFTSPFGVLASLLMLVIIIQTVRLFWTLATPIAPVGDWKAATPPVMAAEARAQIFAAFDPFFRTATAQISGAEVITSLPLTLFGIRSNEATGGGSAIVAGPDGLQQSYAVGEEIMPGVTLHSVAFDHIVISNNGALEMMYMDQSVPAQNVTPAAPALIAARVAITPETLGKSIGVAPRNENGKVTGLVVSAKDDGVVLKAAGLQNGDIVISVNGHPVGTPADLASQFRPGARISLEIERGAQKIPVAIIMGQQ
jgi:general secretion pathway protein C